MQWYTMSLIIVECVQNCEIMCAFVHVLTERAILKLCIKPADHRFNLTKEV